MLASRFSLLLLVAACGGKTVEIDDGGTTDAGPHNDAVSSDVSPPPPPPPDGSPGGCNTIDPGTKTISINQVPQDPPPFGSTGTPPLTPGLYELADITLYTGPNGPSGSGGTAAGEIRVNVANSADYIFQVVSVTNNEAPTHTNSTGNNAGPGTLVIAQTCPSSQPGVKVQYVADASSFRLRVQSSGVTADESFALIAP
jgi:hypothetical protein